MSLLRPGTLRMCIALAKIRVSQDQCEVFFEHMPDGLPRHARGFNGDVRTALRREPVNTARLVAGTDEAPQRRTLIGYLNAVRSRRRGARVAYPHPRCTT